MNISPREMKLAITTMAVVLVASSWYLIDSKLPQWEEMERAETQARQQIHRYKTAIKMEPRWTADLEKLQSQLRVFPVSHRSVSPELMKTIKSISARHGLDITRSQPYAEKSTGDLFEMGINCTWQGELKALVGFLAELQQQGVRYDVRQLNITPVGRKSSALKGNMVVHCAYIRKEAPEKENP